VLPLGGDQFEKEFEVESNFRNHNPLFLDMAEEGIVLIEDHWWLENLLTETRDYVRQRGIKKTENGWIFPVERGVPTYLSQHRREDICRVFAY